MSKAFSLFLFFSSELKAFLENLRYVIERGKARFLSYTIAFAIYANNSNTDFESSEIVQVFILSEAEIYHKKRNFHLNSWSFGAYKILLLHTTDERVQLSKLKTSIYSPRSC